MITFAPFSFRGQSCRCRLKQTVSIALMVEFYHQAREMDSRIVVYNFKIRLNNEQADME